MDGIWGEKKKNWNSMGTFITNIDTEVTVYSHFREANLQREPTC